MNYNTTLWLGGVRCPSGLFRIHIAFVGYICTYSTVYALEPRVWPLAHLPPQFQKLLMFKIDL